MKGNSHWIGLSNFRLHLLSFCGMVSIVISGYAQTWDSHMKSAAGEVRKGNVEKALEIYEKALSEASTESQKAETSVMLAGLLVQSARSDPSAEGRFSKAESLYSQSLRTVPKELEPRARNNYAALLIRKGRGGEAISILQGIRDSLKQTDLIPRSRYAYNLGKAVEQGQDWSRALDYYQESLRLDPDFEPASRAIARLSLNSPSEDTGIPELVSLIENKLEHHDLDSVEQYLRTGLRNTRWRYHPLYDKLIITLVRYFTVIAQSPDSYSRDWHKFLFPIYSGKNDEVATRVRQIDSAYLGDWSSRTPNRGREYHRAWSMNNKTAATLSDFLKMIGDWYSSRKGMARDALSRYELAWDLNTTNADAALYMANILLQSSTEVDPGGEVLEQLIFRLFEGKGQAYLGEDWENILRFHTVLGTIFESQEKWGPSGNPMSAVFQWENALKAHARLIMSGNAPTKYVPGLHLKLGTAYKALGEDKRAWTELISATEGYLDMKDPDAATLCLSKASSVGYVPSKDESEFAKSLSTKIEGSFPRDRN